MSIRQNGTGRKTNDCTGYALRITRYVSHGWILCVPLVLLTCASPPLIIPEYGAPALDFTLKDQNDQEIQLSQFRGENVLLFGFDKDSVDNGGTWLTLFLERYPEGLRILPIADGSSMPLSARLFLKGKVKAEAQDAAEEFNLSSFLLDWTGEALSAVWNGSQDTDDCTDRSCGAHSTGATASRVNRGGGARCF